MKKQESNQSIPNEQSSLSIEALSQNSTPVKNGANNTTIETDDERKKSSSLAIKEPP